MLRKMKPVKLSGDGMSNLVKKFSSQEESTVAPKSLDPKNFPVHEIPLGIKELIYVPNHTFLDDEGKEHLRMDTPLIHSVKDGRRFLYYRCIQGIVDEEAGYDGNCPLCDATNDAWDLANYQIKEKCESMGLNSEDKDNKQVKDIRSSCYGDMALKNATRYYTFPIVVIKTEKDQGKFPVTDENGNLVYTIQWYSISEAQYNKKWVPTLEAMEDDPSHPGGHFFVLDYSFVPKNGEANKRDAAQNVSVHARNVFKGDAADKIKAALDKATEAWTPEKAMETVINNLPYSVDDLDEVQSVVLAETRNLLELFRAKKEAKEAAGIEGETQFNLEKKDGDVPDGGVELDETDEDFGGLTEE